MKFVHLSESDWCSAFLSGGLTRTGPAKLIPHDAELKKVLVQHDKSKAMKIPSATEVKQAVYKQAIALESPPEKPSRPRSSSIKSPSSETKHRSSTSRTSPISPQLPNSPMSPTDSRDQLEKLRTQRADSSADSHSGSAARRRKISSASQSKNRSYSVVMKAMDAVTEAAINDGIASTLFADEEDENSEEDRRQNEEQERVRRIFLGLGDYKTSQLRHPLSHRSSRVETRPPDPVELPKKNENEDDLLDVVGMMERVQGVLEEVCDPTNENYYADELSSMNLTEDPINGAYAFSRFVLNLKEKQKQSQTRTTMNHAALFKALGAQDFQSEITYSSFRNFVLETFREIEPTTFKRVFQKLGLEMEAPIDFDNFRALLKEFRSEQDLLNSRIKEETALALWKSLGGREDLSGEVSVELLESHSHSNLLAPLARQLISNKQHFMTFQQLSRYLHQDKPSKDSTVTEPISRSMTQVIQTSLAENTTMTEDDSLNPKQSFLATSFGVTAKMKIKSKKIQQARPTTASKLNDLVNKHEVTIGNIRSNVGENHPSPYTVHSRIFLRPLLHRQLLERQNSMMDSEELSEQFMRNYLHHKLANRARCSSPYSQNSLQSSNMSYMLS